MLSLFHISLSGKWQPTIIYKRGFIYPIESFYVIRGISFLSPSTSSQTPSHRADESFWLTSELHKYMIFVNLFDDKSACWKGAAWRVRGDVPPLHVSLNMWIASSCLTVQIDSSWNSNRCWITMIIRAFVLVEANIYIHDSKNHVLMTIQPQVGVILTALHQPCVTVFTMIRLMH